MIPAWNPAHSSGILGRGRFGPRRGLRCSARTAGTTTARRMRSANHAARRWGRHARPVGRSTDPAAVFAAIAGTL
jgi:hypothetical protein